MSDRVSVTISGGVADVRMNRPDKRNALDPAMFAALVEAGEALKSDTSVRAVVLSGEGASFCAGLDFSGFQAMAGQGDRNGQAAVGAIPDGRITHLGQQAAWVWHEMPVPTIAAVHGHALGGGCQIAVGCDIRFVHPATQMSVLEVRWGLTPDMTITWLLADLVGTDMAKELTWTGRMVSGEEAVRLGLCTHLSDNPRDDALALAAEVAAKNPYAIRGAKQLFAMRASATVAEQFEAERRVIGSLIGTPNQVEAVTAFFEKRAPSFGDVEG